MLVNGICVFSLYIKSYMLTLTIMHHLSVCPSFYFSEVTYKFVFYLLGPLPSFFQLFLIVLGTSPHTISSLLPFVLIWSPPLPAVRVLFPISHCVLLILSTSNRKQTDQLFGASAAFPSLSAVHLHMQKNISLIKLDTTFILLASC